jgi:energy-coupling factor transport system ATP-binding protein
MKPVRQRPGARWCRADAASGHGLLTLLTDLRRTTGLTVIVISHDFSGLEELRPRTLHLHKGALLPAPAAT